MTMLYFVELTCTDGRPLIINLNYVTHIEPIYDPVSMQDTGTTHIQLGTDWVAVMHPFAQVQTTFRQIALTLFTEATQKGTDPPGFPTPTPTPTGTPPTKAN